MHTRYDSPRSLLRACAALTALFFLAAHGYRCLSLSFSADAMLISQTGDALYQVSLGRFLQPVYWLVRGHLTAPLTVGLFAFAFLTRSAYLCARLFGLTRLWQLALLCGILTANETMAVSSAAYLPWMDVYALSLLLNALGAALFFRGGAASLLCILPLTLSLGLYQSYLPVFSTLVILVLLMRLLRGESPSPVWKQGLSACALMVVSLLLYALLLRGVLALTGMEANHDYNGVGNVALPALSALPQLLADTYTTPLTMLFSLSDTPAMPWHISLIPAPLNILCFAAAGALLALRLRGRRARTVLTALFLVAILPLSVNFIQFIAGGTSNGLTIYAYNLLYLLPMLLAPDAGGRLQRLLAISGCALLALFLAVNVRNANQMAVKRDLEFSATTSAISRILDRAEQTEGYLPGETPVVIVGMLPSSALAMERPGLEAVADAQGMRYTYAAAYETSTYWYLQMALGERINLVPHEQRVKLDNKARRMPAYPDEGCCRMIGGRLYIRLN